MAKADDQTGLASGLLLMWARQEITLGVYGRAVPTPLRVALWGPYGAFPAINDWCVAMMLTWSWWSLGGLLLAGQVELATHLKKKLS